MSGCFNPCFDGLAVRAWGKKGKQGYGIAHIIEKRDNEGETDPVFEGQKGRDVALRLPVVIQKGTLSETYQRGSKRNIDFAGYRVVLRLDKSGKDQRWVLTGYRISQKRKNPDEIDEVQQFIQSYANEAYMVMRPQMGAGFLEDTNYAKQRKNPSSLWSQTVKKEVAKLDKEFDELLEEKGIKPTTKEAADLWASEGFKRRIKIIYNQGNAHKLIVRIQRLQSLGNDSSKEIEQLNELLGKDTWSWNEGKTQILMSEERSNPKAAKFVFLGVVDRILIDQGKKLLVELQGARAMLTNKAKTKIFIIPFELISQLTGLVKDKKAEEIFAEWNNYAVDGNDMQVRWPDEAKTLPVGTAHSIYYISDKVLREGDGKGKMNVYHHEFDAGKRPASKKGNILIVGNVEIDERGILD